MSQQGLSSPGSNSRHNSYFHGILDIFHMGPFPFRSGNRIKLWEHNQIRTFKSEPVFPYALIWIWSLNGSLSVSIPHLQKNIHFLAVTGSGKKISFPCPIGRFPLRGTKIQNDIQEGLSGCTVLWTELLGESILSEAWQLASTLLILQAQKVTWMWNGNKPDLSQCCIPLVAYCVLIYGIYLPPLNEELYSLLCAYLTYYPDK